MRVLALPLLLVVPLTATAGTNCDDYAARPHWITAIETPGTVTDVATRGTFAYFTDGSGFLQVVDLAVPEVPVVHPGAGPIGSSTAAVAVSGPFAYVQSTTGLHVFDLTNPAAPVLTGTAPTTYAYPDVEVAGGVAYVMGLGQVEIVDVSDPASPVIVAAIPQLVADLSVRGTTLVGVGAGQARKWDVSDPAAPSLLGTFVDDPGYGGTTHLSAAALDGDHLYVIRNHLTCLEFQDCTHDESLLVFDVADLAGPIASLPLGRQSLASLHVEGGAAYVSSPGAGLYVVDVSNPGDPRAGYRNAAGASARMATLTIGGRTILCGARGTLGLQVYDVTDPGGPHAVDDGPVAAIHHDLDASGDLVYGLQSFISAWGGYGYAFTVYDASNPDVVEQVGGASGYGDSYRDLERVGDDLYTRSVRRLYRSSLADPLSPGEPSLVPSVDWVADLASRDPYLFVATGSGGLEVVDAAAAGYPVVTTIPGDTDALSVDGDHLAALGAGGLRMFGVSEPVAPALLGELAGSGSWLALRGGLAVVAESRTLRLVDVSDPAVPVTRSSLVLPDTPTAALIRGAQVYVADGRQGLVVIDVADASAPRVLGGFATDDALGIAASGEALLVGDRDVLVPLRFDCALGAAVGSPVPVPRRGIACLGVTPNPFLSETTLRYDVDRATRVRARIFDVAGRRVRTLRADARGAGEWSLRWDGRAADGRAVPPGVYYVRLEAGGDVDGARVVRLR